MNADGKKWHYLAVKSLSGLLQGITSNLDGDHYCMNCLYLHATKNKLKSHESVCENHVYCHMLVTKEGKNIFRCNQVRKPLKILFILYAEKKFLLEKNLACDNNPEEVFTAKISKHTVDVHYLYTVHLIAVKANTIFKEELTTWKSFVQV